MKKNEELKTTEVAQALKNTGIGVEDVSPFIEFCDQLGGLLLIEMGKKNMSVDVLADFSCVNRSTIYKTLRGLMQPEKDTILRWAFVLELSVEDTQKMLLASSRGKLSAHVKRELEIINGLAKKYDLAKMDNVLAEKGLKPLLKPE